MDFVGIDLHKTTSQICTLSEGGELTERRIKSTRAAFGEVFAGRPPARILVEASTESEWARSTWRVVLQESSLGYNPLTCSPISHPESYP